MNLRLFLLFAFFPVYVSTLNGQTARHINSDSLYSLARELAFNKQHDGAKHLCNYILAHDSMYLDARVLLGRLYAWDKQNDSARKEFRKVLDTKKTYWDALDGMIDNESWSNQQNIALKYCDTALTYYPNDKSFLLKRAQLNIGQENYKAAGSDLLLVRQSDPSNSKAMELSKQIKQSRQLNRVEVDYQFDYFEQPWIRRWHLFATSYSRTTKYGVFTGRVLVGDIVKDNESLFSNSPGIQFEAEAYPKITSTAYLYAAYAYSPDSIFPRNRAGLEWFQKLPHRWEVSLGGRYMQFAGDTNNVGGFFTLTASTGFYFRNFWLSFRPYYTFLYKGVSQSYNLEFRTYFKSADQYISVLAGYGNSVDDPRNFLAGATPYTLTSYRARLAYRQIFFSRFVMEPAVQYIYEEYMPSTYRNSWSFGVRLFLYF